MTSQDREERGSQVKALLVRLQGPLIRYALQITGDLERARDVVQDTFLQLCSEDLNSLNGHLEAWLYTVCRNRALDVRRKEDRMNPISETITEPDAGVPDVLFSLQQAETFRSALEILHTLPANQQEVIRLKFQDELSYREISHITGLSVSNVGFLIHAGLKTIRQSMLAHLRENSQVLRRVK